MGWRGDVPPSPGLEGGGRTRNPPQKVNFFFPEILAFLAKKCQNWTFWLIWWSCSLHAGPSFGNPDLVTVRADVPPAGTEGGGSDQLKNAK